MSSVCISFKGLVRLSSLVPKSWCKQSPLVRLLMSRKTRLKRETLLAPHCHNGTCRYVRTLSLRFVWIKSKTFYFWNRTLSLRFVWIKSKTFYFWNRSKRVYFKRPWISFWVLTKWLWFSPPSSLQIVRPSNGPVLACNVEASPSSKYPKRVGRIAF